MSRAVIVLGLLLALCHQRVAEGQPTCTCTLEYNPVCVKGKTYGNPCGAKCDGYKEGDWTMGECVKRSPIPSPRPRCICTGEYDPVCYEGYTYRNPCFAICSGVAAIHGSCGSKCGCPRIYNPVCAKGRTFHNSCMAQCLGYQQYTPGECPLAPFICDAGSSTAKCPSDVCTNSDSPCVGNPTVTCINNPCSSIFYFGTLVVGRQCKPVYFNKFTLMVERNCDKALPPLVCDRGSGPRPRAVTARCAGNPCELTTSPCKGDARYVCLINSCSKITYLSTTRTNAACTAIFVDPLTRTVASQC